MILWRAFNLRIPPSIMKFLRSLPLIVTLLGALVVAGSALAHEAHNKAKGTADKAPYPMTTCVVSGDKLEDGEMGPPIDYVYKEAGKPDRIVRLCCKSCVKDFNKDPQKYLKMIDDAAAGKMPKAPAEKGGHGEHKH